MDDAITELRNTEERTKKADTNATRLTKELRREQEHTVHIDRHYTFPSMEQYISTSIVMSII